MILQRTPASIDAWATFPIESLRKPLFEFNVVKMFEVWTKIGRKSELIDIEALKGGLSKERNMCDASRTRLSIEVKNQGMDSSPSTYRRLERRSIVSE